MTKSEAIIKVSNLNKTFRSRGNKNIITGLWRPDWEVFTAVRNSSFEIARGETVAFLGPNGAGKTTTTKMLSGIMHPSGGEVKILGYTPHERDPDYLRSIGLVMGNKTGLNWDLTARQSYQLLKEIYQLDEKTYQQQIRMFTDLLDIENILDRQIRQLSLGERMKVELTGAILHNPEILFLDEPTIGLDIDAKFAVREFLIKLKEHNNVTIVLTSHDMDDIEHVCKRVLVINEGELIFDDSLAKLNSRYAMWRYMRLTFEGDADERELEKHGTILQHEGHSYLLKIKKTQLVPATTAFGGMEGLADIGITSVPLERIVSDLFKKRPSA